MGRSERLAPVAQVVERGPYKAEVAGSSPAGAAGARQADIVRSVIGEVVG